MVIRILLGLGLVVLGAGFIFFAANVIFLGTKEFFKIYGKRANEDNGSKKLETKTDCIDSNAQA